jgi:hypothetical protein
VSRAATLACLGDYAEAIVEVDRLLPNRDDRLTLTACARVYAAAASAVARDPKLSSEEQRRRADELATRAMELLNRGCAEGEFTTKVAIAALKVDRTFEPFRSRTDFVLLLQKIESLARK